MGVSSVELRSNRISPEQKLELSVTILAADRITFLGMGTLLRNEPRLALTGTVTRDCSRVISAVSRSKPEVVLLDLAIGKPQEVFDCCQKIKEAVENIEVIIFTDIEDPGIVERSQEAGAIGVVSRLGDTREFAKAVLFAGRHQTYIGTSLRDLPTIPELSGRQRAILELLAEGMDTQAIAKTLTVSPETIKSHVKVILQKLGAVGRTHAVAIGMRRGLIG